MRVSGTHLRRNESGNMLSMTALVGGVLIFLLVLGFCLYMLFAEQLRGQNDTDKTALEFAKTLNEKDRVGKINNIVARNRELIFLSRDSLNQAQASRSDTWIPLANYLCNEARSSNTLVENERKQQIEYSKKAVRDAVEQFNLKTTQKPSMFLPWWKSSQGDIYDVSLGYVDRVAANVENSKVFPQLRDYDEQEKYFQKGSDLYFGNINAKLPSPDNDLDFKFASLPAPVEKTVAPARLINQDVYKPFADVYANHKAVNNKIDQLPTALKLVRHADVTIVSGDKQSMQESSTAASTGSTPVPQIDFDQ